MPDNTKYIFNGSEYGKGRLVLALVKQYVNDNSPGYGELKRIFPSSLQGSLDVVINSADLATKRQSSKDSKIRYFNKEADSLRTSDGEIVYVSTEWGSGNIDIFINKAKELGYEIQVVRDMKKTIKELFDEYKSIPENNWVISFKERSDQLLMYKGKKPEEYDIELLNDVWKSARNGVASVKPGFISNSEYNSLIDDLPEITSKIVQDPSPSTFDDVIRWAKDANDKGKFSTIKWGVINRVFATANPKDCSTLLRKSHVIDLIKRLNEIYGLGISTQGNWAALNLALITALRSQGLQNEDVFMVNTFVWRLYKMFVDNKSVDHGSANDSDQVVSLNRESCGNVIYYGPPGTGKTFKLQKLLKQDYTDNAVVPDKKFWLISQLEELSWYEIVILILLESDTPIKVADITSHEYYIIKAEINERGANLRATAWSALQSHAITDSTTVNYSSRQEPLLFDKTEDSRWYIVDSQKEQLDGYIKLLGRLNTGPQQADSIKRYEFVTFHQSYGYEEFVEGLRPISNDEGDISYEIKPGVFKRLCKRAEADPDNKYAIVIDEINRGNISKIFGELITLVEVDKRAGAENELTVTLPYSGLLFSVPANLDIIGTMNTADRSLTHIDVALRRRFEFDEFRADYSLITGRPDGIQLNYLLYAMNQRIELLLDRDHILGHALLMKVDSIEALAHVFKTSILPLLEEYFFENWEKINQVLNNNGFIKEQRNAQNIWLGITDEYAAKSYLINTPALIDASAYMTIYNVADEMAFAELEQS